MEEQILTERAIQIAFERELYLINPELALKQKLTSDTLLSILNNAIEKFVVTRTTGINYKRESFEQTQKRTDDLRTLVVTADIPMESIDTVKYEAVFPKDYMFMLGDTAFILPLSDSARKCWPKDKNGNYIKRSTDTIEGTVETIDGILNNSLSEHNLRYSKARPVKIVSQRGVLLYTDGQYSVNNYELTYLKKPKKLTIDSMSQEYTDLPEHTIREIVQIAVGLYMSTQNDQRYNSINSEIATME